jgi:hypothetical protein
MKALLGSAVLAAVSVFFLHTNMRIVDLVGVMTDHPILVADARLILVWVLFVGTTTLIVDRGKERFKTLIVAVATMMTLWGIFFLVFLKVATPAPINSIDMNGLIMKYGTLALDPGFINPIVAEMVRTRFIGDIMTYAYFLSVILAGLVLIVRWFIQSLRKKVKGTITILCPQCGNPFIGKNKFCTNCGASGQSAPRSASECLRPGGQPSESTLPRMKIKHRFIAVEVFLFLVIGITTRSQVIQWFHHIGYYRYISANIVEVAANKEDLEDREAYNAAFEQYQKDEFNWEQIMWVRKQEAMKKAAEMRANGASEEAIDESIEADGGTIAFHQPQPPKEPLAITKYKVLTNAGVSVLPLFSTELNRCEIIYSKDPDLRSKKMAQIVVSANNSGDDRNVFRHGEITVWAETRNIVPAEPRPSICQLDR